MRRDLQKELTPNQAKSNASTPATYTRLISAWPARCFWYSRQPAPPQIVAKTRKKKPVTSSHKVWVALRTDFAVAESPKPAAFSTLLRAFGFSAYRAADPSPAPICPAALDLARFSRASLKLRFYAPVSIKTSRKGGIATTFPSRIASKCLREWVFRLRCTRPAAPRRSKG